MESENEPIPLYTIGITYNLKKGIKSDAEDEEAEYDSMDTILAIRDALQRLNCRVELFEANSDIFDMLKSTKVDMVFNIAEGICGRGREAQIPAILNFFRIPYTGSDETTLCIALDKALCKRLLSISKVKTPKYQLISSYPFKLNSNLSFPLIIKPNAEGSSKGISDVAIVEDVDKLKKVVYRSMGLYKQPLLIEEFIKGREFTVGIIGNGQDITVFPPMEIVYKDKDINNNIYSFNVKKDFKKYVDYVCPAHIDERIEKSMILIAKKIYKSLECRDFARVDFRLSPENDIYFIEINPLPGLAPGYSDYPMIASFCGIHYTELIKMILNSALKRNGLEPIK